MVFTLSKPLQVAVMHVFMFPSYVLVLNEIYISGFLCQPSVILDLINWF